MYEFCEDYEKIFENIVASAYSYVASSKLKTLVIGMSGGIDSALTAALAQEVIKRLDNKVLLAGRVIDIYSNVTEMKRASKTAEAFCHTYKYHCLEDLYKLASDRIMHTNRDNMKTHIRRGNIKARLRMIELYDLANELDGMVLSTDNYTEYLLGFWTLHGDVGDFGMIQNLWKTEVYGLAEYMVARFNRSKQYLQADSLKECIDAVPTDGLGITNSDFDQIYPDHNPNKSSKEIYEDIDIMLAGYLNYSDIHPANKHKAYGKDIIERYKRTKFKRNNPFNIPREYIMYNKIG